MSTSHAGEVAVRPLDARFGVEVLGVDARTVLPAGVQRYLVDAWREHSLLLLRNQELTVEEQLRFAALFGKIERNQYAREGWCYVSNVAEGAYNPFGELQLHSDHAILAELLEGLMLYAIEVPPPGSGGDTLFANAKLAYRSLPEELRSRLSRLKVRHQKDFISRLSKDDPVPSAGNADLQATRPLALEHPVTRERLLYLCRRYNPSILGLSKDESDALVSDLLDRLERAENLYRHVWRPGDVIVWDNITLLHARTDFDPKQARHLRRVIFGALPSDQAA